MYVMATSNILLKIIRNSITNNGIKLFTTSTKSLDNLDLEEIAKFRKVAHEWWDPKGPLKGLFSMNALRVPFIRDGILSVANQENDNPKPLKGYKLLDVGCGGGLLSEPLARLGADVTGIDPVEQSIQVALTHALTDPDFGGNLTYSCVTVESLYPEYSAHFDAVIASEVIEHVPDPISFVNNCLNLVKPGGSFFVTTINKTQLSWLLAIIAAENVFGLIPRGTHDWDKFISPLDLSSITEKAGCRVKKIHGMRYIPFLDKWSWQDDTQVNYAFFAVKME